MDAKPTIVFSFEELYDDRAEYVFFLCSRLESRGEYADILNQEVWRRVRRQLLQVKGVSLDKWLCTRIVESHRRLARRFRNRESESVTAEASLGACIDRLQLEQRWALILKECAGFSYGEIAEILGVPLSTIRERIGRARVNLRRMLEQTDG